MIKDRVAIILVNYNNYSDTRECIESLRSITYPEFEIFVVDNASSDDSEQKLSHFLKKERLICMSNNNGFSSGNNQAIRLVLNEKFEYVLLLNNDTIVEPDFLDNLIISCKKNKNACIVAPKILNYYKKNMVWYAGGEFSFADGTVIHNRYGLPDNSSDVEKEVTFISGCCMLIPVEIIRNIGLLDENFFLYCEDLDYCLRAIKSKYKLIFQPKAVIYHKISSSTGKVPNISTYYNVRNSLYIFDDHLSKRNRSIAKLIFFLRTIYRTIKRDYNWRIVKKAINDYDNKVYGKVEDLFEKKRKSNKN